MTSLTAQNDYLTTSEASQFLQVTRFTVLNWIKQGKLQAVTTLGGHQRIPKEVLAAFIQRTKSINPIETKSKANEAIICCWEAKEIIESRQHDCARCLVFKKKANRCFLSIRNFGSMKIECGSDCADCAYLAKYFPEEKKAMEGVQPKTVCQAETKAVVRKIAQVDGILNKISFNSGKCIASIKHKLAKPRSKMLKSESKNNERRN